MYEKNLQIPYYIVFDRYSDDFRAFHLKTGHYEALSLPDQKLWIPELNIGLGLWEGTYKGIERPWLRWYDADGTWVKTEIERAQAAEAELEALKARMRAQGLDPNAL
ncbi:MAG: hypothetical protein AAF921_20605 [Cyanobacteria bacterium P01_D01_bin.44]